MKKILLINTFWVICQLSSAQENIKHFVKNNTSLIEFGQEKNFDVIANAIKGRNIVLLGEQDHGDGQTFLVKSALIKYLHEKFNFNVIIFESDFFALNEGWQNTNGSSNSKELLLSENILPVWSRCNACFDLLRNYIPTDKNIQIAGIDNQIIMRYSQNNLSHFIDSIMTICGINNEKFSDSIEATINFLLQASPYLKPNSYEFNTNNNNLEYLKLQLLKKTDSLNFAVLLVNNLISFNNELNILKTASIEAEKIRDRQMFENLMWLINVKFAGEKVIVWAANSHIAKYFDEKHGYKTMAKWLEEAKINFYNIGFTSSAGYTGIVGRDSSKIRSPLNNSLEAWINPRVDYGFIDFTAFNRNNIGKGSESFFMTPWRYFPYKNDWNHIFDGILYIRNMISCNY